MEGLEEESLDDEKMREAMASAEEIKVGDLVDAKDCQGNWYPGKVVSVRDGEEREGKVHFKDFNAKYDEWIVISHARIRLRPHTPKFLQKGDVSVGSFVLAKWGSRLYPARVEAMDVSGGTVEVLYEDGLRKKLPAKSLRALAQPDLAAAMENPSFGEAKPCPGPKSPNLCPEAPRDLAALIGGTRKRSTTPRSATPTSDGRQSASMEERPEAPPPDSEGMTAQESEQAREKRRPKLTAKASEFVSSLHSRRNFAESVKAKPSRSDESLEPPVDEHEHRTRRPSKLAADPDFIVGPVKRPRTSDEGPKRARTASAGEPAPKRKRGRPPSESKPKVEAPPLVEGVKRKRGRPPTKRPPSPPGSPGEELPLAAVLAPKVASPVGVEEEMPLASFKEAAPPEDAAPPPPVPPAPAPEPEKPATPLPKEPEENPLDPEWEERWEWLAWDPDTGTAYCCTCHRIRGLKHPKEPWIAGLKPDRVSVSLIEEHDACKEHAKAVKKREEEVAAEEAARAEELQKKVAEWRWGRETWMRDRLDPATGERQLYCLVCSEGARLRKVAGGAWVEGLPFNRVGSAAGHEVTNNHKKNYGRYYASELASPAPASPPVLAHLSPDVNPALLAVVEVKCEYEGCGKSFRTPNSLASHVRHYHRPPSSHKRQRTYTGSSTSTRSADEALKEDEDSDVPASPTLQSTDIVRCKCRDPEENGFMVQCERCETWQHGDCFGIRCETDVPDSYTCYVCRDPPRKRESARELEFARAKWGEGLLPSFGLPQTVPNPPGSNPLPAHKRAPLLKKTIQMAQYGAELADRLKSLRLRMHVVSSPSHPWHAAWTADAGGAEAEKARIRAAQSKIEKQLDQLETAVSEAERDWGSIGAGGLLQTSPEDSLAAGGVHGVASALIRDLGKATKMAQLLQ